MTVTAVAESVALNLGKAPPATSATSDSPTAVVPGPALSASGSEAVIAAPAPTEPALLPDEGKATPTATAAPEAKDADAADPAKEGKPDETPPWMKARISKEANRAKAAEERAAAAEAKADAASKQASEALEAIKALTPKAPDPFDVPRPKREAFDNPDIYEAAIEKWTADRTAATVRAEEAARYEAKTTEERQQAEAKAQEESNRAMVESFNQRRQQAVEKFPDYETVAEAEDVQISIPMAHVILNVENGPDVAYHLGKNKEEAARIASLHPANQAFEMGKLAARLEAQAVKSITREPPPPSHIGQNETAHEIPLAEKSMDDYAAARLAKIRAGARQ